MQVNKSELKCSFDVDETLLMAARPKTFRDGQIKSVKLDYYGTPRVRWPHIRHIEIIKAHKARGFYIRVFSANGWRWAEQAVKALGLEDYVDIAETKDQVIFDDKPDCGIPVVWVEDT